MESEIRILLSIESLNIFHSTSKKELANKNKISIDLLILRIFANGYL